MIFPPPGWSWPNVFTTAVSLIALGLSIATFVQRRRYHPQPKIVGQWHAATVRDASEVPAPVLFVMNHGDAPARDVRVEVSTCPGDGKARVIVEAGSALGRIEAPLTRQSKEEINSQADYVWKPTVPLDQVHWERPVVTVTWRQAPFANKPKKATFKVPDEMLHEGSI